MHPSEPKLEELKVIEKELMVAESTNENVKKLEALAIQIARHEKIRGKALSAPELAPKTSSAPKATEKE